MEDGVKVLVTAEDNGGEEGRGGLDGREDEVVVVTSDTLVATIAANFPLDVVVVRVPRTIE